jgi:hypothetical protein
VGITCYLLNRSPSSAFVDKTPNEAWTGKKNPLLNILKFLFVMLMYMYQRNIRVSWIIKLKSVSLLVIKMV